MSVEPTDCYQSFLRSWRDVATGVGEGGEPCNPLKDRSRSAAEVLPRAKFGLFPQTFIFTRFRGHKWDDRKMG